MLDEWGGSAPTDSYEWADVDGSIIWYTGTL